MPERMDVYTRNARLLPAFIVCLPFAITALCLGSRWSAISASLIGTLSSLGLPFLLSQLGRDWGKKKEPLLFEQWGGMPTTTAMRHTSTLLDATTRERYHLAASALLGGIAMPSPEEEALNPQKADGIYEAFARLLRAETRDVNKYPLLFRENINYGFRRNLWGMKLIGVSFCLANFLACAVLCSVMIFKGLTLPVLLPLATTLHFAFLLFWMVLINSRWVKVAAVAYAERLLETSDSVLRKGTEKWTREISGATPTTNKR